MSKIVYWTADLETGFHDIDEQHKQLVHYINEFYKAYESGDKQVMNTVLFDLIACSMNHFEYEEGLMAKAGYPLLEPHRRVHQKACRQRLRPAGQYPRRQKEHGLGAGTGA